MTPSLKALANKYQVITEGSFDPNGSGDTQFTPKPGAPMSSTPDTVNSSFDPLTCEECCEDSMKEFIKSNADVLDQFTRFMKMKKQPRMK